jgi:hypothetical protein
MYSTICGCFHCPQSANDLYVEKLRCYGTPAASLFAPLRKVLMRF